MGVKPTSVTRRNIKREFHKTRDAWSVSKLYFCVGVYNLVHLFDGNINEEDGNIVCVCDCMRACVSNQVYLLNKYNHSLLAKIN